MSQTTLQRNISRLMALLLCLMLLLPCIPVARADGGSCGDGLTWDFDGSTLTISGSGTMANYTEESPAPWAAYRDAILSLSLPDGLTRIGSYAFADCTALRSVTIPGSVEVIDESAFLRCSGLSMVTFHQGLHTIGVCAFEQCTALADIRLPGSLISIGDHAFYLCKSLTYVTIPGSVRTIGSGVFAYCSSLIRADIDAAVTMPGWSFYGCDKLQVVTIQGNAVPPESLKIVTPPEGIPGESIPEEDTKTYETTAPTAAPSAAEPTVQPSQGVATGESITVDSFGNSVVDRISVSQNADAVVTTTTRTPASGSGTSSTEITSTIQNEDGWKDVLDKVDAASLGQGSDPLQLTVMMPNSSTVSKEVLKELAGKNVTVNIQTQSGANFILNCKNMDKDKIRKDLELTYTIVPAENIPESLTGCIVYSLRFHVSASVNMEIVLRLPGEHGHQNASLYQIKKQNAPELLQTVLVDGDSNAHFYLASVDDKTEYLIGINVPGVTVTEAVIPDNLYDEYRLVDHSTGKEYVITGRTSSWNMGLGKVMAILAVVMVSAIVVVGAVMFFWNKQRLKNGYVPKWDDEEE